MKSSLEIVIRTNGFFFSHSRDTHTEEVVGTDIDIGERLALFCRQHGIGSNSVSLFFSEDQVHVASLVLPLKTPDISEAVGFQIGLLSPFSGEDILYDHTADRAEEGYQVIVFSARASAASVVIEELVEAGFEIKGLYPESQRYVTKKWKGLRWALILPGKLTRIRIFQGYRLQETLVSRTEANHDQLVELCGTENLFHGAPPEGGGFRPVQLLLAGEPVLRDFNLLPAMYRRPDYFKGVLVFLAVLNLCGLIALAGLLFYTQNKLILEADREITRLMPQVRLVKNYKDDVAKVESFLDASQDLAGNPDIIRFLESLTNVLPENSFLDNFQLNSEDRVVSIFGYTDDIGVMTENLQELGTTKLKSTSRRKDRTYFQVEISLQ
ncbi:MAG: hypothetical protein KJ950_14290 [Proteobacteria bacterium]|nr:hypothetical protein [Pseudomonadota bacterium]MBU1685936.1 hypothetical protein [Pseudomonadota bacterium]